METTSYYDEYWRDATDSEGDWTPCIGPVTDEERQLFEAWLPSGTSCLDYGCGNGLRYGRLLRDAGVDYHGFDLSEEAVRQAVEAGLDVKALDPDGTTSLPDASVDAAVCFEVLEHLQEPERAMAELMRCLKPGGHALLSVPNAAYWSQRLEFLLTGFWCPGGSPITARHQPWSDPHIRFFHPPMLRRLATSSGFEVAELVGQAFTLGSLPVVWRRPELRSRFDAASRPLNGLGRRLPSMFAARLFLVAKKPEVRGAAA